MRQYLDIFHSEALSAEEACGGKGVTIVSAAKGSAILVEVGSVGGDEGSQKLGIYYGVAKVEKSLLIVERVPDRENSRNA